MDVNKLKKIISSSGKNEETILAELDMLKKEYGISSTQMQKTKLMTSSPSSIFCSHRCWMFAVSSGDILKMTATAALRME